MNDEGTPEEAPVDQPPTSLPVASADDARCPRCGGFAAALGGSIPVCPTCWAETVIALEQARP